MGNLRNSTLLLCILFIYQICFGYTNNPYPSVGCINFERLALMEFKESLVDNAHRLWSWAGDDCCTWDGITCNNLTGHVEKLDLHNPILPINDKFSFYDSNLYNLYVNNSLRGEINPSLLNLDHLRFLDLSCNNFSGIQIPTFIGSFKNIRYLNLSSAGFCGEIPYHLGNLSTLQYLDLGRSFYVTSVNLLTAKSLEWIIGLHSLKALDLSYNNLSESVDWLYSVNMLPSLSSLKLRNCQLVVRVHPPLSLVNLTSLVSIDLGQNQLNSVLPLWLFNLTSMPERLNALTWLDLSYNYISSSSVIDLLCNHTSLISLDLMANEFQGSFPLCLGNLTSLRVLNLGFNKFRGKIPSELGHSKQLSLLDLSYNYFKCSIPTSLGQLTKLKYLDLSGNQLYGEVPSILGQFHQLEELYISFNSLTGELSESHFVKLKSLKILDISCNYLLTINVSSQWIPPFQLYYIIVDSLHIGPQFPPWLQTQKNVFQLSMTNVSISGTIPDYLCNLSSLRTIDLAHNQLIGNIPLCFGNLRMLQFFSLANNQLTGNIPLCFGNLRMLQIFSLANNQLTGNIPLCFGNLRYLQVLDLGNNSLSGHIPSTLGKLEELNVLHLNRNKLYGVLPSALKNLKVLTRLDLGENQLIGTIPEWIGEELSYLQFFRLQSNHFCGNISVHLCQLSSLHVLNLAQNNLVGRIPHCFGNLGMMMANDVGFTMYYLDYVEALEITAKGIELEYSSNLGLLKSISLSGNNLQGEIPIELMDLDGLQSLNLSNNHLSGKIPEKIGNLKHLESLDLALNNLSGPIPSSLANIDTLSYLNLSFNNLSGRIPSGNHFQTLIGPSVYEGNSGLCGKPLTNNCPDDDSPSKKNGPASDPINDDDEFEWLWFYAGIGPGFAFGFLGVLCLLYFKKSWCHALFAFVENVYK